MTDSCAAQIAAGALREGRWNAVLGTTLALKGSTRELLRDPEGVVYSHRHPDGGWLPGGASSTGAKILVQLFAERNLSELEAAASERGPSSTIAYPLISEGEWFPFYRPEAQGFWIGDPQDEVDRYLAVLEGVAFVERLCFVYLESLGAKVEGSIALTGGGARSLYWSQLRSDVLGHPVLIPHSSEPAVGMAILARAGVGSVTGASDHMTRVKVRLEPDDSRSKRLAANLERLLDASIERGFLRPELARRARIT